MLDKNKRIDAELKEIIKNFYNSGEILVKGDRNLIKVFSYQGKSIAVKSFKKPSLLNAFIYKFLRDSKAKRSYLNGIFLDSKNIGTPKPIAFYENFSFFGLKESFYVCENLQYDFMFRKVFEGMETNNQEKVLRAITNFTFEMHENGILFLDHSPGNTLIKIDNKGHYKCFLIDLNRMTFKQNLTLRSRIKNMNKLTPEVNMLKIIANEYSKLVCVDEYVVRELLYNETKKFYEMFTKKQELKKKLFFWKK